MSEIEIDSNGIFQYKNDSIMWENLDRYINSVEPSSDIFKHEYDHELYDSKTREVYGIGVSEIIEQFIPKLFDTNISGDSYMIAGRNTWTNVLKDELNINDEQSEILLSRLIHGVDTNIESKFFKSTSSRALRNPLIEVGNHIISPLGLIQFSLLGHYMDILEGETQISSLNNHATKILNKRNTDFEKQIVEYLKKEKDIINAKYDVQQNSIKGVEGEEIRIPRQIDVLFYYKSKIFVVEAKHSSFKFTPKAVANDVKRFSEIKKDSHQNKLDEKVQSVVKYKKHVLAYLGLDPCTEIKGIEGCFITKNITKSSFSEDLKYPIYNINEIELMLE